MMCGPLLSKLSEVANKAKGGSDDQSKTLFKQLLRRPAFKDRCAKAIDRTEKASATAHQRDPRRRS